MKIVGVPATEMRQRKALLERVLNRPLFAHLATTCPDGPRVSPCWFLWEEQRIWIIAQVDNTFADRIAADERCALSIVDFDVASGTVYHVGMRGTGAIEPWQCARAIRLLSRYLGDHVDVWPGRFVDSLDDGTNQWVTFAPQTVVVRDQSY